MLGYGRAATPKQALAKYKKSLKLISSCVYQIINLLLGSTSTSPINISSTSTPFLLLPWEFNCTSGKGRVHVRFHQYVPEYCTLLYCDTKWLCYYNTASYWLSVCCKECIRWSDFWPHFEWRALDLLYKFTLYSWRTLLKLVNPF